jgi:hypothetical protein
MSKKIKYLIFFIITIAYLFFEVTFRLEMLNAAAIGKDYLEIKSIEMVGRLLASIGFVIFLLTNIKLNFIKNIIFKITGYIVLGIISFIGFFLLQTYLINNIGDNFSSKEKQEMALLQMDKELIYYNKLNHKDFNFSQENTPESKILLSFYPFIRYKEPVHSNKLIIGKELIIENSVQEKWKHNVENFDIMVEKEAVILNKFYSSYYNTSDKISHLYPFNKKDLHNLYQAMNNSFSIVYRDKGEQYYIQSKEHIKNTIQGIEKIKNIDKFNKRFSFNLNQSDNIEEALNRTLHSDMLYYIFHNNSNLIGFSHMMYFAYPELIDIFVLEKDNNNYSFNYTNLLSDFNLAPPISNLNCKSSILSSEKHLLTINEETDDKTSYKTYISKIQYNEFYNKLYNKDNIDKTNSIECIFKKKEMKPYYNKISKKVLSTVYFSQNRVKINRLTKKQINNSEFLRKFGMVSLHLVLMNEEKSFFNLIGKNFSNYNKYVKGINYTTSDKFIESIENINREIYTEAFYKKAKENGFDIDFLKNSDTSQYNTREKFYAIPKVHKILKKTYPFFIDPKTNKLYNNIGFRYNDNKTYIKNYSRYKSKHEIALLKKILSNPSTMDKSGEYEKFGNEVAKSFVAIPVVITISTIMIFLTFLNIIMKTINLFVSDKKHMFKIKTSLLILLIIVPAFYPNLYTGHKNTSDFLENKVNKNLVFWFQNTQSVLELIHIENKYTQITYIAIKQLATLPFEYIGEQNKEIQEKNKQMIKKLLE